MNKRESFTLTEVLVLTGALSVLTAVLLPALGGARETVNRAACASNLRQIGMAMLAYSEDYRGLFPTCYSASADFSRRNCDANCAGPFGNGGATQFFQLLLKRKYIESPKVFVCPSDRFWGANDAKVFPADSWDHSKDASDVNPMRGYNKSYFYVSRLSSRKGSKPYLLMADDTWGMPQHCGNSAPPTGEVMPPVGPRDNHGADGRNALFSDGHVAWINSNRVDQLLQPAMADYDDLGLHFEIVD